MKTNPLFVGMLFCALLQPAQMLMGQSAGDTLSVSGGSKTVLLTAAQLAAMPQTSLTVDNGHTHQQETYTGVPLIDLLTQVGAPAGSQVRGKTLGEYVVAVGADGYKAVLSLAEVEPGFHPGTVLVADKLAGKPLDAKAGPFKLVVSEDKHPARAVHNLVKVELKSAE